MDGNPRDRALETLDRIRAALGDHDLQNALDEIDKLQATLAGWKRDDARQWLENALRAELLLFNGEEARKRLEQWASSATADTEMREIALYRERVQERDRQRQIELQAQGVVGHCEALWREAANLEAGSAPPHPDFLINNYFTKAHDIAAVACAEHPDNVRLDMLLQQAQRLQRNKVRANKVYRMAMEDDRYADALNLLDQFENIAFVPRYRVADDDSTSSDITTFDRMVPIDEARVEIERLGRAWAGHRVKVIQETVTAHLAQYRPQQAVEALAEREKLERFLGDNDRKTLRDLDSRAANDLRLMEQAERRARQALQILEDNPLGAWAVYVEAYQAYAGASNLNEVQAAIVARLAADLEQQIVQAENDFNHKRMTQINEAYAQASSDYAGKDARLDELLRHFEALDQQAHTYQDYLREATALYERVRTLLDDDISAAGEALNQLEDYPDMVLEELPDMAELRRMVRYRLNLELVYNQLYKLLYSRHLPEVERGIAQIGQYESDQRLRGLGNSLKMHSFFLMAQQHYAAGQHREALALLEQVAMRAEHPDYDASRRLLHQVRAELRDEDSGP